VTSTHRPHCRDLTGATCACCLGRWIEAGFKAGM
jgi:hypothetical protein